MIKYISKILLYILVSQQFSLLAQVGLNPNPSFEQSQSNSPSSILKTFNNGGFVLTEKSAIPVKSTNSLKEVTRILEDIKTEEELPTELKNTDEHNFNTIGFELAFNEITKMLETNSVSLKRAVFLSESAYYNASADLNAYLEFEQEIKKMGDIIRSSYVASQIKKKTPLDINKLVMKFLTDTMSYIPVGSEGKVKVSKPIKYDFNDPFGDDDLSKLFVSKLITTKSGQCKSIPLLFLLLVEELGGEAFLSFSPEHSFIKVKNGKGGFYNFELTNGKIMSDALMVASGYIKSEAIRNGIFLDTINQKQVVAQCLVDLANIYRRRFGESEFVLKCANKSLEYFPNNIHGLMLKSNYHTRLFNYMLKSCNAENEEELKKCPKTYKQFQLMHKMYALIDGVGYEPIPEDVYMSWLNEMEKQATAQN